MDAHQTSIYTAVLIAAVLVAVILGFFIVTLIRHHRRNVKLYKAKILAEITTVEQERKRIAADLHDDLGPILAGVKLKLNSMDVHDPQDKVTLGKIHNNLSELMARMREISNDLMPTILLRKGLTEAMELVCDELNHSKNFHIKFVHKDIPQLSEEKAINLFRILQEIIHNTIKHSGSKDLVIEMKVEKGMLILLTSDSGKGFDYNTELKEFSGLGLRNLLSRIEALGGNMYIDTAVAKGTRYSFEVPI